EAFPQAELAEARAADIAPLQGRVWRCLAIPDLVAVKSRDQDAPGKRAPQRIIDDIFSLHSRGEKLRTVRSVLGAAFRALIGDHLEAEKAADLGAVIRRSAAGAGEGHGLRTASSARDDGTCWRIVARRYRCTQPV